MATEKLEVMASAQISRCLDSERYQKLQYHSIALIDFNSRASKCPWLWDSMVISHQEFEINNAINAKVNSVGIAVDRKMQTPSSFEIHSFVP